MNTGIPFLGAFADDKWTVIKFLNSGPFILAELYASNGVRKHSNSEGWEKYNCYFRLTLFFRGLTSNPNPNLYSQVLHELATKQIKPETISSWYNSGICEAFNEYEEEMIDCY